MNSLKDLISTYTPPLKARRAFVVEATERINKERTGKWEKLPEQKIAIIVNFLCPKEGGLSLLRDTQKACQTSKNYAKAFWGIYKKARASIANNPCL